MARITLTPEEYTSGELPPVCVVSGEYAPDHQETELDTCHHAVVYWGMSMPWPCTVVVPVVVVVLMTLSRNFSTQLPICDSHRSYFFNHRLIALGLAASTWASPILAWGTRSEFLLLGAGFQWLVVPVVLFVLSTCEVRARCGHESDLILTGVHSDFVAAVEDARNTMTRGDADCG
jgi:hypothetical protein